MRDNKEKFEYIAIGVIGGCAIAFLFILWTIPEFTKPEIYDVIYNNQNNINKKNLRSLIDTNYISVLINFIGVILLYKTLSSTRMAVEVSADLAKTTRTIGEKQISEMSVANEISRNSINEANRAILFIQNDKTNIEQYISRQNSVFNWEFEIVNVGVHPAFVTKIRNIGFFARENEIGGALLEIDARNNLFGGSEEDENSIFKSTEIIQNNIKIGQNISIHPLDIYPSGFEIPHGVDAYEYIRNEMLSGHHLLCAYMYTIINYRDLKGVEHVTSRLMRQTVISHKFSEQGGTRYNFLA